MQRHNIAGSISTDSSSGKHAVTAWETHVGRGGIAWAAAHLPAQPLYCIMSPDNPASRRVADKCGFGDVHTCQYRGEDTLMLRRKMPG